MSDEIVQVPPNSNGQKIDNSGLTVSGNLVLRQRNVTADPTDPLGLAAVKNIAPTGSEYGTITRTIIGDGLNVTEGALADAAVTGDTAGTISGKLRGLLKIITDVWDNAGHTLKVSIAGALAAGSAIIGKVGIDQTTPGTTNRVDIGSNGTVAISGGVAVAGTVAVSNFPGSFNVSNFPGTQVVSGTVAVSNFPASFSVSNFPGTQAVSNTQLPALLGPQASAGSLSVTFPSDFGGLIVDMTVAVQNLLGLIANPVSVDVPTGRMRVVLDPLGGAQTLATVTTVGTVTTVTTVTTVNTVTNQSQIGAVAASSFIADMMNNSYANQVLRCIA